MSLRVARARRVARVELALLRPSARNRSISEVCFAHHGSVGCSSTPLTRSVRCSSCLCGREREHSTPKGVSSTRALAKQVGADTKRSAGPAP